MTDPRSSLTRTALASSRFVIVSAILACLLGIVALLDYPATEEPSVTLRTATVEAYLPGESAERLEKILARPIEEALRGQSEVKTLDTRIRQGNVLIYVTLRDTVPGGDVSFVWQRLRARLGQIASDLPAGTQGPLLNDDFGRVAVRTIAITGKGYSASDLELWAQHLRNQLQGVDGVASISLHGVRREIAYVDLKPDALRQAGTSVEDVRSALAARDAVAPSGTVTAGGTTLTLQAGDRITRSSDLAAFPVPVRGGSSVPLGSIATIRQIPQAPPQGGAFFDGKPAVVLGVAMQNGLNVMSFADRLEDRLAEIRPTLPAGLHASDITDQAQVVATDIKKVGQVFVETVIIVLAVVMLFLGWRSGLVTGTIVPMTVLGTILIMNVLGIELHQISIAAIILALGIFVDNGIVVVEDYQRRIAEGESRLPAAIAAGETMLKPLLVSSLAIIFAFAPLVAGQTDTAEYMRSLGVVLAITLLVSLLLALTVTPILAHRFISADAHHDEEKGALGKIKRWYGGIVVKVLARPVAVAGGMVALLAGAILLMQAVPAELFPVSQRKQFQVPMEMAPGTRPEEMMKVAARASTLLRDRKLFPEITDHVIYVGDGGPRFILALDPPAPALHRAYAVINVNPHADPDASIARVRNVLAARIPGVDLDPKRFSLGSNEKDVAVFRLVGADRSQLNHAADSLEKALLRIDGMQRVRINAEHPVLALTIEIDQPRIAAAGLSSADVYRALNAVQDGSIASVLRDGDKSVPVIVRADGDERQAMERLGALPVGPASSGVTLGSIARVRLTDTAPFLARRNLMPVVEITARHATMKSQQIVDAAQPAIEALHLPTGTRLELGGEIEEGKKANAGLATYAPLALAGMFLLFLWQFGSVRKSMIVLASMPFVIIGGTLGLLISGQAMSFSAQIGFLALAGIIVNNAVLLIGRIQEDREAGMPLRKAVAHAAEMRLRPIVMTKLTCIAGLVPLYLFGGPLWQPMAAAMMGGLALGTLITLILIPSLYMLAFRRKEDDMPRAIAGDAA